MKNQISRRKFLGNTALTAAGLSIVPSHVVSGLGHTAPSDKLNIAGIGVGGIGKRNLNKMASQNIVALCDVDWNYAKKTFEKYPDAKKYKDFRRMFDEMNKDIDAVMVATPDHTHAIAAYNAMTLGKHVFVEKPLTHSVYESRILTLAAQKYGVATQMGNQGSSSDDIRKIQEWIWNGEIGDIEEVHTWTNRPIWPQGLERPENKQDIPDYLDWDLFIGPAAYRPYNEVYHPWNWRAWWDFGTGALGDMACHIIDPVFRALLLGYPTKVQGSSTQVNTESAPLAEISRFTFPERKKTPDHVKINMPEVKINWYDGGLLPERPKELADGKDMMHKGGGALFVGSKGKLMCGCYAADPFILGREGEEPKAPKVLDRVDDNLDHWTDWVRACKEPKGNRKEASSNFAYAGPFNEMVVMGTLATRLQSLNRELNWDGENMEFTNISNNDQIKVVTTDKFEVIDGHPHFDTQYETKNAKSAAEEYIKHTYRDGWEFPKSVKEI